MFKFLALCVALGVSSTAFAKADCPIHPKSEWMKESDARAQLEAEGYKHLLIHNSTRPETMTE